MDSELTGELTLTGRGRRRPGVWRAALAGLTPQVLAVVAALLFIRMLSSRVEDVIYAAGHHELGAWLLGLVVGYPGLLVMAAPMLAVIIATANLGPQRGPKRIAALGAAVVLSSGAGVTLRVAIQDWLKIGNGWDHFANMLPYLWPRYALLGGMLTVVGELYRRETASIEAMQRAEMDRATFDREIVETRLQVLQAQIEPHFLFNTLANVRRLYDRDVTAGRRMLENLMRYLEVALPRMRDSASTLGRDSELVDAFLRIQRIRMGERLTFSIDIPAALLVHPVPPMMLLTLVENAIKHGLNPSPDGGLIRITAHADVDRLLVSVADTGVGFGPGSGAGTGLANIRARLAAQFGDRAALTLQNNELGGVTATIDLPLAASAIAQ